MFEFNDKLTELFAETDAVEAFMEIHMKSDEVAVMLKKSLFDTDQKSFTYKFASERDREIIRGALMFNPEYKQDSVFCYEFNHGNKYSYIIPLDMVKLFVAYDTLKADNKEPPFNIFNKKQASGKIREIIAPHEAIKAPLRGINNILVKAYDARNSEFQVAYKRGKSILDNALPHVNNKYVFKTDFSKFFDSCRKERVRRYVEFMFSIPLPNNIGLGYEDDYTEFDVIAERVKTEKIDKFMEIITHPVTHEGLFIGSPVSGTLANAMTSKAVALMRNMCKKHDIAFTVYADDITFSSNRFISKDLVMAIIKKSLNAYSLDTELLINEKKSYGLSGSNRHITGVSINDSNECTPRRKMYRWLRTTLNHLRVGDVKIDMPLLKGRLAFATMVDTSGKIARLVDKYRSEIEDHRIFSTEKIEKILCGNGGNNV